MLKKKLIKNNIRIIDAIDGLEKHTSKKWNKRDLLKISGVVFHQTAGNGDLFKIAKYHVGPNHISSTGCPGICYTFGIEKDGRIYLMNELEDITWHASGFNTYTLGVIVFGDFSAGSRVGKSEPTSLQIESLYKLLDYLYFCLLEKNKLSRKAFVGHCELDPTNKPYCPGDVIMSELESWRNA